MVPQVELCDVTNEGLGGIKSAPQGILGQERKQRKEKDMGSEKDRGNPTRSVPAKARFPRF